MKIDYIPLGTKVFYDGFNYITDSACSRSTGKIRILGSGPHSGFFVNVSDLKEVK
jgi:hypothetical protein